MEECTIISRDRMNDKKKERPRELSEAINKHEISFLAKKTCFIIKHLSHAVVSYQFWR